MSSLTFRNNYVIILKYLISHLGVNVWMWLVRLKMHQNFIFFLCIHTQLTIFIPGEAVSEFLALELHVESYRYEYLGLSRVLVEHGRTQIIVAGNSMYEFIFQTGNTNCNTSYVQIKIIYSSPLGKPHKPKGCISAWILTVCNSTQQTLSSLNDKI